MITENIPLHPEIEKLLQEDEGIQLEYKTENEKRRDIAECLTALANSKGGYVIFGIEDPPKGQLPPKIAGIKDSKALIDRVNSAADDCTPSLGVYVSVATIKYQNKSIVIAKIDEHVPMIISVKGRFLKRRGSFNKVMSYEDFIQYAISHKSLLFENMPVPHANWDDLNLDKINEYIQIRQKKSKRNLTLAPQEFLHSINCLIEKKGTLIPNYAGILLFGNNPLRFVPQSEMICIRFRGTKVTRGYIDRQDITGTIPELIDAGVEFVKKNMRIGGYVWGIKRTNYEEYPLKAVREAITNCCAHREYSDNGYTCVYMFDDRIEFSSPGGIPMGITLEQIQNFEFRSRPRNHLITRLLRDMDYMENAGSGLNMMATQMQEHHLPVPVFRELECELRTYFYGPGGQFMQEVTDKENETSQHIILTSNLTEIQLKVLEYVKQNGQITNKIYCKLFGTSNVKAKRELQVLVSKKLLKMHGKGRGTHYKIT
ncbi:hypothetical protein TI05_07055 [Achromatium sp. WMS3]|nr:hypothetical protein TI05_07055 [Achromatium sp. WMS3]